MGTDAATKTAAQFTPGPWRISQKFQLSVEDSTGKFIADAIGRQNIVEDAANARLIAASPQLLAALKNLRNRFHACCVAGGSDPEFADAACTQADAAIAAAEGSAP